MKKLLALMLVLSLCVSTALFTACGSSTFKGNYKETTAEEVTTFMAEIAEDGEEIDILSGVKIVIKADMPMGEETMKVDASMSLTEEEEGKYALTSNYYVKMGETEADMDVVYKDGVSYTNIKTKGAEAKIKATQDIDDALNSLEALEMAFEYDLDMALEMAAQYEGVKIYMDKGEDGAKIKVSGKIEDEGSKGDIELIFVYNAQNKLIASSITMNAEMTYEGETVKTSMTATVEPWSGKISAPSDASDYLGF